MKLLCIETCFMNGLYNEDSVYEFDSERGRELLKSGYFARLEGPPPEKPVEDQPPGRRKKITVK